MEIIDRREFCALAVAGAFALTGRAGSRRSPRLRVGVLAAPAAADARVGGALDGIVLGADEARRTAMLFRADFDMVHSDLSEDADPVAAAAALTEMGAQVLVSTFDGDAAARIDRYAADTGRFVVQLLASPPPDPTASAGARAVYMAPAVDARAEAVRKALREEGTSEQDTLVIATEDPQSAEVMLAAHPAGGRVVDLFGVTERFDPARLPRRLVRADAWLPTLERFGAAQLNDRFRARYGPTAEMRGPAWAGWFAMKALVETSLRARTGEADTIRHALLAARFDGHKGVPLSFSPAGVLLHPLYVTGVATP